MNTVLMNMGSPGGNNEATKMEEYGDEVLFSGWNPQVAMTDELSHTVKATQVTLPVSLRNVDVDAFLQKMYEYQC